MVERLLGLGLRAIHHVPVLRKAYIAHLMLQHSEKIMNLPLTAAFFPTEATEIDKVRGLLAKLHPITCSRELIRVGPDGDGGYLLPNDLDGIQACFSPGVGALSGFEKQCADFGMEVFLADASVERPAENHPRFHFTRKFIGASTHGEFITLADWVRSSYPESQGDLLLQMDIEGFEYETLLNIPTDLQQRLRIIVIEFHHLEYLFSKPLFEVYSRAFEKLLATHRCVHIHPNNFYGTFQVKGMEIPQLAEFTFYRNDRISKPEYATVYPHPLDRDNFEGKSFPLPKSLYRA